MIRRIKAFAGRFPLYAGRDEVADEDDRAAAIADSSLEILCKNAVRSNWSEPDATRVWQQLSGRVTGPFGGLAVEGPAGAQIYANSHEQYSPFTLEDSSEQIPRQKNEAAVDRVNYDLVRMPEGGLLLR